METGEGAMQPSPAESPQPQTKYPRTSCDLCNRMKIKCKRQGESCAHCIARNAKCNTTFVMRKKKPRKDKTRGLVDVESRIKRLEAVLVASGIDPNADPAMMTRKAENPSDLSGRLSLLMVDEEGTAQFLGASSGFSVLLPQGLQWISERMGNESLSQYIDDLYKSGKGLPPKGEAEFWHPMSPSEREPLPPKHIADKYIQNFFDYFNNCFPLYDKAMFTRLYNQQYSGQPPKGSAWYASLNAAICIGSIVQFSSSQDRVNGSSTSRDDCTEEKSWRSFRNASSCFVDLLFKERNLMAIQALCAMAFIQQVYFDPYPSYILISSATRMAHAMGLHRKLDDFGLDPQEMIRRRNIFWILYILDKTIALRTGHPSGMVDDDIGIDLPEEEKQLETAPDGSKFNIFRYQVQMSLLESRIWTELYSTRSQNMPALEQSKSVDELDKALHEWREALPVELRPGEAIRTSQEQFMPVISLHFAYFNCLATIHRASIYHSSPGSCADSLGMQMEPTLDEQRSHRVYRSQTICVRAARRSIQLLPYVDATSHLLPDNFMRVILYYPLASYLTLFSNILYNPHDSHAVPDLQLMSLVTSLLHMVSMKTHPSQLSLPIKLFTKLGEVAEEFVQKANMENMEQIPSQFESPEKVNYILDWMNTETSNPANIHVDSHPSYLAPPVTTDTIDSISIIHPHQSAHQAHEPNHTGNEHLPPTNEFHEFLEYMDWGLPNMCDHRGLY